MKEYMSRIGDLLSVISHTPSSTDKKALVLAHRSPLLDQIFQDTYDKTRKYYVKKFQMPDPRDAGVNTIEENYDVFHDMLDALSRRDVTGDAAVEFVEGTILSFVAEDRDVLARILGRNLKVGVSLENYNKAVGAQTVKKYKVALAEKLQDVKGVDVVDGTYYVSRKLDGVRTTIHVHNEVNPDGSLNQTVKFISRQGKEFKTLDNLIPAIKSVTRFFVGDWVLDGETCLVDKDGNENFLGLMSEVTRKDHTIEHPKFMWFDFVTLAEFEGRAESEPFKDRLNQMCEAYYQSGCPKEITVLEQELIQDEDTFVRWRNRAKKEGWEGLMLRKNAPYKSGRSKDLIKVKEMQDAEYVVKGVEFGRAVYNEGGSKEYEIASSITIEHKGNVVNVGSGLSKEQRLRWRWHPEEIIGKTITVQYFEETRDKKTGAYSLRFPILKYVYEGEREV